MLAEEHISMSFFSLDDLHRILLGKGSWWLLLEVFARSAFLFVLIMSSMRLLGRRVASQYTLFELSVVVTLAGAVGVPLQATDRGLLPPLLIMAVVIALQRCMSFASLKNGKVDKLVAGEVSVILCNGEICLDELRKAVLSRERLFSLLRGRGVQHLGQLSRVYLEPSGNIAVVWADTPRHGLSIVPDIDHSLRQAMQVNGTWCCASCGFAREAEPEHSATCDRCEARAWQAAATELED
jgi:uncharacterized membrane protein YcaP (DUF421 family)